MKKVLSLAFLKQNKMAVEKKQEQYSYNALQRSKRESQNTQNTHR